MYRKEKYFAMYKLFTHNSTRTRPSWKPSKIWPERVPLDAHNEITNVKCFKYICAYTIFLQLSNVVKFYLDK